MRGAAKYEPQYILQRCISTHAPHARRGVFFYPISGQRRQFLLTRLMRGAANLIILITKFHFISTHAPHARRGIADYMGVPVGVNFYSRASCEARL